MKATKVNDWSDYWKAFDSLRQTFRESDRAFLAEELTNAMGYVNGLTDGWYQFLDAFKAVIAKNSQHLSKSEKEEADILIRHVERMLGRR